MKHLSTVLVILAALVMTASGLAQEQPGDPPTAEDEQPGEEHQNGVWTEFTLEIHSNGEVYFLMADENGQQDEQDPDQMDDQNQQDQQDDQNQQDQQDDQNQQDQQDRNPDLRVPANTEITITLWGVGPQEHNIVVNGEASDFVSNGEETTFTFMSGEAGTQLEYYSQNDEMARGMIHTEAAEATPVTPPEAPPEDRDDPFVPEDPGEPAPEDDDVETPAPGIIAVIGVFALAALLYKRRK